MLEPSILKSSPSSKRARTTAKQFSWRESPQAVLRHPPPPMPSELVSAENATFYFEGWSTPFSGAVSDWLTTARTSRNDSLKSLSSEQLADVENETSAHLEEVRAALFQQLGLAGAHDGDVLQAADGSVWRRVHSLPRIAEISSGEPGGGFGDADETQDACEESKHACRSKGAGAPEGLGPNHGGARKGGQKNAFDPAEEISIPEATEDIFGTDDRVLRSRSNGYGMNNGVWGPKALLQLTNDNPDPASGELFVRCSAVKVGPRSFLSVGHCLYENGDWKPTRRLVPGADGLGTYHNGTLDPSPNGSDISQWRYIRGYWYDHEWDNYDFGVLMLYDSSPLRCKWWHGWQENTSGLTQVGVHMYGYPGELLDCSDAGSTGPNGKCWASIYGDSRNVVREGAYRIYYYIDSQEGQSGSGVYRILGSSRIVYAVHRGNYSLVENDAIRLNAGNVDLLQDAISDNPASPCN